MPRPLAAAVVGGAVLIGTVVAGVYHPSGDSAADAIVFLTGAPAAAVVSFFLGRLPRRIDGVLGLIVLTAALEVGNVNPLPAVITVGFWLVGSAARSHRDLAVALQARAFELESGREAHIDEAVRFERARIAREMHDIVAHSLSVIVIQASAGQRLPASDTGAPQMLADIVDLTREVRRDLGGLSRLLDADSPISPLLSQQSIDELVKRTAATGSALTCTVPDGLDRLPVGVSTVAYRVIQEGLTNAIKHAPGAPIQVTITVGDTLSLAVVNGESRRPRAAEPAAPGSGRGLVGLTSRIHDAHGRFSAGPTSPDGWSMCAELPLKASRQVAAPV